MPTVRTRLRVTEGEMVQITKRIPPGTWASYAFGPGWADLIVEDSAIEALFVLAELRGIDTTSYRENPQMVC